MERKTRVHVFGNRELGFDSLPLRLIPKLREAFPGVEFVELDPNEEWNIPNPFLIIDTVQGIRDIRVFHGLDEFDAAPTISAHDFDALFNLRYLAKLGKLKRVIIIGVPLDIDETAALTKTSAALENILSA
jgi:hypothetical protein